MEYRPILKLSDEVIGQIAAGEVVERPASAVKELVENSIDAGATAITVELKDGGISYIRVSDNGKGIPAGQIRMAFERHATSKLSTAAELFDVHTLGFRGEALASIAAIAKVTCTSRSRDAEYGVKAQVEAGDFVSVTEAASPIGTTVVVRELFYNTPVRLKFLKKAQAEAAMVSDYILRLILSKPDIAFRFVSQGKSVYRSVGDGTLESALYCVYGKEALKELRRVQGTYSGVIVDGYVGIGELARGNRLQQSFFINGRYFRDERISKALESGCEGYLMVGRYPICALAIQMPYRLVDVNVHPNKLEVRFQNPEAVAHAVEELTHEALSAVTIQERLLGQQNTILEQVAAPVSVISLQAENAGEIPADFTAPAIPGHPDPADAIENAALIEDSAPLPDHKAAATVSGAQTDRPAPTRESGDAARPDPYSLPKTPVTAETSSLTHDATTIPSMRENGSLLADASETLVRAQDARWVGERNPPESAQPDHPSMPMATAQTLPPAANPNAEPPLVLTFAERTQAENTAPAGRLPQLRTQWVQETMPGDERPVQIRYIGAIFKTYLLFEAGERLLMVDQHAAHERILYDRLMARYQGNHISQPLLSPQVLRFTARDVAHIVEIGDALTEAGFDLEAFDMTNIAVRAIPIILGESEPVRDLLLDVLDETQTGHGKITRDRLRRRVAQMACKHAIKAGDTLSAADVQGLLEQMLSTGAQPTCPHGRPIVTELTRRELEKRFKRIQ